MVSISHTKIKSESKKYKGQWYPKFYVNSPNWNKPKRPRYRSILFYYRADTPEKKKQNTQSQKLLNAIYKELKEQYKGAEYREGQESSITLKMWPQKVSLFLFRFGVHVPSYGSGFQISKV